MKNSIKLIILKNISIHTLLVPLYFLIKHEVMLMPVDKYDTLLLFIGLIVIAPITPNFIYTYKNAESELAFIFGHITTFLSMTVIGALFLTLDILLVEMLGNVIIFRMILLTFWATVVTFDFADFYTTQKAKSFF